MSNSTSANVQDSSIRRWSIQISKSLQRLLHINLGEALYSRGMQGSTMCKTCTFLQPVPMAKTWRTLLLRYVRIVALILMEVPHPKCRPIYVPYHDGYSMYNKSFLWRHKPLSLSPTCIVYTNLSEWSMKHEILMSHCSLELSILLRVCPSICKDLCISPLHTMTKYYWTLDTKILYQPCKTNRPVMMPFNHTP